MRTVMFFPTLVGIGFLAQSALAETCTSPDDPSCTITCDDGCLAGTGEGGCITQCSNAPVVPRSKPLTGAYLSTSKSCQLMSYLRGWQSPEHNCCTDMTNSGIGSSKIFRGQ